MDSFYLSFASLLLIFNSTLALTSSNFTTDEHALLAFKNGVASDPRAVLSSNWSTNTSICYWIGVSCGRKHHRVTALNVSGFNLGGTVPPHLGNLTFLLSLDISSNNFTGFLPIELSNLRRLKEINAGVNSFTGEIPSWFGALSKLRRLYLNNNTFSGRIPLSLSNLSVLQTLDLGYNSLDGNLPNEIGNFSYLEILKLGNNKFTGSIPYSILNISSLTEIILRYNWLSGELPNDICINTPQLRNMYLSANRFSGEIPVNMYKCKELEDLRLAKNCFTGNILSEIGSLRKLRLLNLFSNNFTGSIPNEIGKLTSLNFLDLSSNKITGSIPNEIGKLNSLIFLELSSNNMTGGIPKEIGNLTYLKNLYIRNNNLKGCIPKEIGNLTSLEYLNLSHNNLNGSVPHSMFNISALKLLALSFNQFSGCLPSSIGKFSFSNLEQLHLEYNQFNGKIPSFITNATKLTVLELPVNSFSGLVPDFGNLRRLRKLNIWGNQLTGAESPTQELGFLLPLTNCLNLKDLVITNNPLNGTLPSLIGNFSPSLQLFHASGCNIKGVIPSKIGNLSSLIGLYLHENQMTGSIPTSIGNLKKLERLELQSNQLQGHISVDLCRMSKLGELWLSGNMLTGSIPECLGQLESLRYIYLNSNELNSTIPSNIWNLRDLLTLNLSSNSLSGQISPQIGNLRAIYQVDLSSNQFVGDIPSLIDSCKSLEFLSLSNNNFIGSIPKSLANNRGLTTLDLSNNNLSGLIPKSLEDLRFLRNFNVSYNKLAGEIPNGGCFVNFTAQSFVHNFALCGATRFQVPSCSKNQRASRLKRVGGLMKYIAPSIIIATILVIVVLLHIRKKGEKTIPLSTDISPNIEWRRISYMELERATSSFSESNLLGRGSSGMVFKGTLSDGMNIAVKVFNLQLEGAIKSFDTETKILSSVQHRNLVPIIGCCSNMEFKALILVYMPKGSLEKWLYSDTYCLDLGQRLNIAIDVALALEYLHHCYQFPIVHCDIKPSNVLFDEEMTAHVGDFGIAKLFENGEVMVQTKTLATIGYAAPEYGMEGKVSTNGDVYSYGIMLLEIFTGKKPTDDIFGGELNLKEWVGEALQKNAVIELLAPDLLSNEDEHFTMNQQCILSIFELAMKCLVVSPEERIDMIEVGTLLHKIKGRLVADIMHRVRWFATPPAGKSPPLDRLTSSSSLPNFNPTGKMVYKYSSSFSNRPAQPWYKWSEKEPLDTPLDGDSTVHSMVHPTMQK